MGHGDFKMLAMIGAWLGVDTLPFVILIATSLALLISIFLLFMRKLTSKAPIPFGPFLAVGAWSCLILCKNLYSK